MRPAAGRCVECHADDHGGQLAGRADAPDCAACHAVAGWKPSSFAMAAHARLRLPLNGRHAEVACEACHGPARKGLPALPPAAKLGRAGVALTLREIACPACHVDPHEGRYAERGARPQPAGCESCHDARRFRPSTVDVEAHGKYAFQLEGAHRAVPCAGCHTELKRPGRTTSLVASGPAGPRLRFAVEPAGCENCHENPHGDQFAAGSAPGGCERCHGVDAFRPASRFDHERDTSFLLKGAHEAVRCASCHVPGTDASGRPMVVYRPLSAKCESCHAAGERRS